MVVRCGAAWFWARSPAPIGFIELAEFYRPNVTMNAMAPLRLARSQRARRMPPPQRMQPPLSWQKDAMNGLFNKNASIMRLSAWMHLT